MTYFFVEKMSTEHFLRCDGYQQSLCCEWDHCCVFVVAGGSYEGDESGWDNWQNVPAVGWGMSNWAVPPPPPPDDSHVSRCFCCVLCCHPQKGPPGLLTEGSMSMTESGLACVFYV